MKNQTISASAISRVCLLLAAVLAISMASCTSENEPTVLELEQSLELKYRNPVTRSSQEAIEIANNALRQFDEETRSRSITEDRYVDLSSGVKVICAPNGRNVAKSDTLIYVVNFANDKGYALVSAPRIKEGLLALTSSGHYDPEEQVLDPNPGFSMWLNNAMAYVAEKDNPNFLGGDILPPVRDTTLKPIQQKEWNDTIVNTIIGPQIKNAWGQGIINVLNLQTHPEGFLFSNGLCGCGPLAIAQICLYYEYPKMVEYWGNFYNLDWSKIKTHRLRHDNENSCYKDDLTHSMIAWLCYSIGQKANATPGQYVTSTNANDLVNALKLMLPHKSISKTWTMINNTEVLPGPGQIMLMYGHINDGKKEDGHAWVCDGGHTIEYIHYFATRESNSDVWEIQSKSTQTTKYSHFNWGWYGLDDGWFYQFQVPTSLGIAYKFHYVMVK